MWIKQQKKRRKKSNNIKIVFKVEYINCVVFFLSWAVASADAAWYVYPKFYFVILYCV